MYILVGQKSEADGDGWCGAGGGGGSFVVNSDDVPIIIAGGGGGIVGDGNFTNYGCDGDVIGAYESSSFQLLSGEPNGILEPCKPKSNSHPLSFDSFSESKSPILFTTNWILKIYL